MIKTTNIFGNSLIESIVAISVVSFLIMIFAASYTIITTNKYLKHKNLALNLAAEEIEALRGIPISGLSNRTNGDFIEVPYNIGTWQVSASASAPSLPNVYSLNLPAAISTGITGIATVPGFDFDDYTFETQIKNLPDSPSNWRAGVLFRLHDINNYYKVYFNSTNLYVSKNVSGTETNLNSKLKSFSTNTWYELKIVALDNSFEIYIDDLLELSASDVDENFASGKIALLGINSIHAEYDDASITSGSAQTWNFDSDAVGTTPSQWKRFGLNDLPAGIGKLTIQDYEDTYSDIKDITARIEWTERNITKAVELKTLLAE
ncbi:hypothetical protein KKF61_01750 [Patescibacteria group bacterium]|nr:hypothetical protein [Patescibacteria group bacterium]MBU0964631.1 hypothetical protein [Patescibacteria group bacterium]